ncbi:MAG: TIGR02301 family protein [Pseudomonadota bacterium]
MSGIFMAPTRLKSGLLALALLATPLTAQAQEPEAEKSKGNYQAQMVELAEILGHLHHLRPLCVQREDQVWRNQMTELIQLENPPRERRNEIIKQFNAGFEAAQSQYRSCNQAAQLRARALAQTGERLTANLVGNIAL